MRAVLSDLMARPGPVLESIESSFDDVAPLVGLTVERLRVPPSGAFSLPVRCLVRLFPGLWP